MTFDQIDEARQLYWDLGHKVDTLEEALRLVHRGAFYHVHFQLYAGEWKCADFNELYRDDGLSEAELYDFLAP